MRVEKDFKEFIALLNKNGVKYLVIGGFAFAFYAKPRFTKDIDFFVEASEENSKKIIKALNQFGFSSMGLTEADFWKPRQIIQLGYQPMRIDIVTTVSGLEFEDAWANRVTGKYGDVDCFFISKEDLIKKKQTSGRPQDIADIKFLKKNK